MSFIAVVGLVIAAFLLGSIPFGYLFVRGLRGTDIRDVGTGNIGATNVSRELGRVGWLATLLADAGKGAVAVAMAQGWESSTAASRLEATANATALGGFGSSVDAGWLPAAVAFGAILGHCYTPWLGWRGGKGVATMLGSFAVLAPAVALAAVVAFIAAAGVWRFASVGSLAAAMMLVVGSWALSQPLATQLAATATLILVVWRHRTNIDRLRAGTEGEPDRDRGPHPDSLTGGVAEPGEPQETVGRSQDTHLERGSQ